MNYSETANIYSQKLEEREFKRIQEFMLKNLGVKLSPIKIVMVNSRLIKRLKASGIYTFPEYVNYALSVEGKRTGELQCMIDELTTHKTEFFRESEHFDFLRNTVLPEFVKNRNSFFKIWSAGCSTGEEAYTMAMVLDQFQFGNSGFNYSIEASDVSKAVVNKAMQASYTPQQIKGLEERLIKKYFKIIKDEKGELYQVNQPLRDKINFSLINLVDQYKFMNNSLDAVFCRNTLIYFEDQAKRDVVARLISKIKPGGFLFVGLSETVSQYSTAIKQMSPSVYKKIG
ncbi:CheR family methyltransferase [Roseimarinus sediminis]|jgi:chemotaxis protein methyltransferase CheR|uniref:CheR family methyltransferase n=1 Tax=Roseimarinus sediminis TaxID=1610899 RepID=UPI003D1DAB58